MSSQLCCSYLYYKASSSQLLPALLKTSPPSSCSLPIPPQPPQGMEPRALLCIHMQPQFYAEVRDEGIVWAYMPVQFQNCTQAGNLPGCLFQYDEPEAQCSDKRTGNLCNIVCLFVFHPRFNCASMHQCVGFLCGKCPNGTHTDLTLTSCTDCPPWHAVLIAAIGEYVELCRR